MMRYFFLRPDEGNERFGESWNYINGLIQVFTVECPSLVKVFGHVSFENKSTSSQEKGFIMLGLDAWDWGGNRIPGFLQTTNFDWARHYEVMPVSGAYCVEPGTHRLGLVARIDPAERGPVCVKDPAYSGITITIESL